MHTIHNSILSTTTEHLEAIKIYNEAQKKGETLLNTSDGFKILETTTQVFWQNIKIYFGWTNRISKEATELNLAKHIYYQLLIDIESNQDSLKWLHSIDQKSCISASVPLILERAKSSQLRNAEMINTIQDHLVTLQKSYQEKIQPGFWAKRKVVVLSQPGQHDTFGKDLLNLVNLYQNKTLSTKEARHLNAMLYNGINGIQDLDLLEVILTETKQFKGFQVSEKGLKLFEDKENKVRE